MRLCLKVGRVVGSDAALKILRHTVPNPAVQQSGNLREGFPSHQVLGIALAAELCQGTDDETEHKAADDHPDDGGDDLHEHHIHEDIHTYIRTYIHDE